MTPAGSPFADDPSDPVDPVDPVDLFDTDGEQQPVRETVDSGLAELLPDVDRPRAWLLLLNGTPQSYVDLEDPTYLEFEYTRRLGHVVDGLPPGPLRAMHLGGGGMTLARYVAATRPGSRQRVVECDAAMAPLPDGVDVLVADARAGLAVASPDPGLGVGPETDFDVVLVDVFVGPRIPSHVGSIEFVRAAAAALRRGGVFTANVADGGALPYARAQAATVAAVFRHVCVIANADVLTGRRFGNLVLAGSDAPLPVAELRRACAGDPFPARVVHGGELADLIAGVEPATDATAMRSPTPPPGFFGVS
jgi:hypothetical protein